MGKQRTESAQILRALGIEGVLISPPKPKNKMSRISHPAIKMWIGYEVALQYYFNVFSSEWIRRCYRHNMGLFDVDYNNLVFPYWVGNEEFHSRHRAALLYKNYEWYKQFGWTEEPKIDYIWPSNHKGGEDLNKTILKGEKECDSMNF